MKLSEAIRLGSMLGPQCFWKAYDGKGGSCAFGAAYQAIGESPKVDVSEFWPWVDQPGDCPVCECTERASGTVVSSHLNDMHRWSRERIADWVATVEPEEAAAPVEFDRVAEGVPA